MNLATPEEVKALIGGQPFLPMNVKRLWIAGLRCGRYRQVYGILRDGPRAFCGIGMLAHLTSIQPHQMWHWLSTHDRQTIIEMNDSGSSFHAIADWIERNL